MSVPISVLTKYKDIDDFDRSIISCVNCIDQLNNSSYINLTGIKVNMLDCLSPLILSFVAAFNLCLISVMLLRHCLVRGKQIKHSMKFYTFVSLWIYLALFVFVNFLEIDYLMSKSLLSYVHMSMRVMLNVSTFAVLYVVIKKATKQQSNKTTILRFTLISFAVCLVLNMVMINRIHDNYIRIRDEYQEEIAKDEKTVKDLVMKLRFELCNNSVFIIDSAIELF